MKIGYARVSTRDQTPDLQVDALKAAGCERVYQDVASGAKAARPALDELLGQLRNGDVLVIWKLDRLGRSLKHLVELVDRLMKLGVGLVSLNDPVDTTHAQGRFVFNLFASLAEFEREVISERTQAGLSAARARGRVGGDRQACRRRPKRSPWPPRPCTARENCRLPRSPRSCTFPRARSTVTCAIAALRLARTGNRRNVTPPFPRKSPRSC